jgi:hypothetical protein
MAITKLAQWEANMTEWGQYLMDSYDEPSIGDELAQVNSYYDAINTFYNIKNYTGAPDWVTTGVPKAYYALVTYYMIPAGYVVPGYWNFTTGLAQMWLDDGNATAQNDVVQLSTLASYSKEVPDTLTELRDPNLSRENAYAIIAHINAERCGQARRSRITTLVDNAINYHIDEWCTSLTADYFRPFMGALTAWALIQYYENIEEDSRILPALMTLADYMHDSCWDETENSWNYTDRDVGVAEDLFPAPDLNLLIVPYLGWIYSKTFDTKWRDRGDLAFDGGVSVYDGISHQSGAYLGGRSSTGISGKQFNQSYMWSHRYLEWRAIGEAGAQGGGGGGGGGSGSVVVGTAEGTSILEIIQDTSLLVGLNPPETVVGASDINVRRMLAIAHEAGFIMKQDYQWAELEKVGTVTLQADVAQYSLAADFQRFIYRTHWDRTNNWELNGPMTPQEWEYIENGNTAITPRRRFRCFGSPSNKINISPVPSSTEGGQILSYEYYSGSWILPRFWGEGEVFAADTYCSYDGLIYQTTAGGTCGDTPPEHTDGELTDGGVLWTYYNRVYDKFLADTDITLLNPYVVSLCIQYRWLMLNGLDYEAKYAEYREAAAKAAIALRSARTLDLSNRPVTILINSGSIPDTGYGDE